MSSTDFRQVNLTARRQRGLITTQQLGAAGWSPSSIRKAMAAGRLLRFRPGVYLLPGSSPTWETSVLAAVLGAGAGVVASHLTAARLWDLEPDRTLGRAAETGPDDWRGIDLTSARRLSLAGVIAHRRDLPPREVARVKAVPATSVARTLFDLAAVMDAERLGRCTDEALRRSIVGLEEIRRVYDSNAGSGRRRTGPIRAVLAERVPGFDPGANAWERAMDDLWDRLGLPPALRQYPIKAPGGRRYRVDRAIVELRLAVEWVGIEYHGQVGRFRRDRVRISDLLLAGWDVIEVTPDWSPARISRTVRAKVAEREALLGLPRTGSG